jgi:hypothetical protein
MCIKEKSIDSRQRSAIVYYITAHTSFKGLVYPHIEAAQQEYLVRTARLTEARRNRNSSTRVTGKNKPLQ